MQRSKSTSNIISLKAPVKEKHGKRISFGETETRTMDAREDVRSRLGYGRQASPPPPEDSTDVMMQTKIQKIALGGGRFEMRKVMNMVNSELGRQSEERQEKEEAAKVKEMEEQTSSGRMSSAGVFAAEGVLGKLKISVRNDPKALQVSVKNDLKRSPAEEEVEKPKPKKRLAMYRTLADGTVEKEYIGYDDPILAKVPIQKKKSEELGARTSVTIAKDKTASNFQVVRRPSSSSSSSLQQEKVVTLAEKAKEVRSKVEEVEGRRFETLASRAQRRRSVSPEVARGGGGLKARVGEATRDRSPLRQEKKIFDRLGPKF